MMDIVERLESINHRAFLGETIYRDAALEIEALRAENTRLRKALNGLVDVAQYCDGINTSEQLRAARAAMGESDE